jgi:NAD(P)H-hydrate epimerase
MRPLVSCAEAARLDRETRESAALPAILLMEDASLGLWRALRPIAARLGAGLPEGAPLVALCGAGNNAGDALALMRHARFEGLSNLALVLGREGLGEPSSSYLQSLRALGLPLLSWERERSACLELMAGAALLVDGIAGTGLDGPLRGGLAELALAANESCRPLASIDLPSGLRDGFAQGDPLVEADWTLSIEPRKAALYAPSQRLAAGEVIAVDGVFPASAASGSPTCLIEEGDLAAWLPPDSPDAHKGSRGRLAAFAGAIGSTGAACIASRSALAAGAGLVALFASPEALPILSSRLDSVMVKPEPEEAGALKAERWDALLAGPGWGRSDRNRAALGRLLASGLPAVLDADAIRLYAELRASGFKSSGPLVLTPHPGEFEALTGLPPSRSLADPAPALRRAAAELGAVVLLKSQVTWIAAPDGRLAVWEGLESGLATAGSGDALAGLAAGLLASLAAAGLPAGEAAFRAARAAVAAHGVAGKRLRAARGWFEAADIGAEAARILGGSR